MFVGTSTCSNAANVTVFIQPLHICQLAMLDPTATLTWLSASSPMQCDACELALDVFKEMRADGVRPNVVTYNTLVDVFGKIGQWERAVRVLDDMSQDVSVPNILSPDRQTRH